MGRPIVGWIALATGAVLAAGCLLWAGLLCATVWPFGGLTMLGTLAANNPALWITWAGLLLLGAGLVAAALRMVHHRPGPPGPGVF